jgi:hypothetical protein
MASTNVSRRRVLRGMLGGTAVTLGLPLLNAQLNGNGVALASGAPVPTRFGTWSWGLGMNKSIFVPKTIGANYDLPEEIESLKPVRDQINILTNFRLPTDGRPNLCHFTGWVAIRTGYIPTTKNDLPYPTVDVLISDEIGTTTRFKSLDLAATGVARDSVSLRNGDTINAPVISAVEFYRQIFGSDFQDPNSAVFKPSTKIMVRKSVLSAVGEQRRQLLASVGSDDRARLDQYFTALRELENRLELQLQRPQPAVACRIPDPVGQEAAPGLDFDLVAARHRSMTDLLVLALACNQARVFNMVYSNSSANTTRPGQAKTHHILTHEELVDQKLGYQPESSWFIRRAMESWSYFVQALASFKEGDGTLLDHSLVFAQSDQEYAKVHSIDGIPMMTAGTANGKVRTGLHIDGKGALATNVGFTLQHIMGVPAGDWGVGSLRTDREVSEILS